MWRSVRLVVPQGSPDGKATLSAMVDVAGEDSLELGQATLTIGDAGDPVGSARISSAIVKFDKTGKRSSTSLRTREVSYLKLEVMNSRRAITDDREVESIIITAAGGKLTARGAMTSHEHLLRFTADDSDDFPDANALTEFTVESIDRQPIHIDVYAFVIGADGSVQSNTLVVNFAGQADSLTIGSPSGALAARHSSVRIPVSGLDSDGNRDDLSIANVLAVITEGPEGADLTLLTIGKSKCSSSQRDCELGDVILSVSSTRAAGEQAEHGTYEIEVQLEDDLNDVVYMTEVQVVGEPVAMTLELLDGGDPAVRRIFTSTGRKDYVVGSGEPEQLIVGLTQSVYAAVTLRDEDGVLVSNTDTSISGDGVRFQIVGALSGQPVLDNRGGGHRRRRLHPLPGRRRRGPRADHCDLARPGGFAAIVAQEKSRFDLSGLTRDTAEDYTAWIGANDVRISDIYGLLQARGITSALLWLSGEQRWLRYSVVGDAAVPGSVDFLITYGDTLWLSG